MKLSSRELWAAFTDNLNAVITEAEVPVLNDAWVSQHDRTEYYMQTLLPLICKRMGLLFEREFLRVDATFSKKGDSGYTVPLVFIESENNYESSDQEISKLCALNAPLKVLMLCRDWDDNTFNEIAKDHYHYILKDYCQHNMLIGCLGVIIASWDDQALWFRSFMYDERGEISEDVRPIVKDDR